MKKYYLLITLSLLFISNSARSDWFQIDAKGSLIPFSKIARPGKVSVFIVGITGCSPCIVLKESLWGDKTMDLTKVDFYYVNLASGISQEELNQTSGYKLWRQIEKLEAYPYVYILSPTTNIISRGNFTASVVKKNINSILEAFKDVEMQDIDNTYKLTAYKIDTKTENNDQSGRSIVQSPKKNLKVDNKNLDFKIENNQKFKYLKIKIKTIEADSVDTEYSDEEIHINLSQNSYNTKDLQKLKNKFASTFAIEISVNNKEMTITPEIKIRNLKVIEDKKSEKGWLIIIIKYETVENADMSDTTS
jgi:hypothetical protein